MTLPFGTSIGPVSRGPAVVEQIPAAAFGAVSQGASIPSSSSLTTTIGAAGWSTLALGLTASNAGYVSATPYFDYPPTIAAGAAVTQAVSAGTAVIFRPALTQPFQSIGLTVANTSTGGPSSITSIIGLLLGQS